MENENKLVKTDQSNVAKIDQNAIQLIDPEVEINFAVKCAKALTSVINQKKKKVIINGEQYIEFEDWQTLGQFYGMTVKTQDAQQIVIDGIKGAYAKAEVVSVKNGIIIGGAEAYCLSNEKNWISKPFFQLASMAQTRAAAKALRNILSRVVVLAGYSPTPAEEMIGQEIKRNPVLPPRPVARPAAPIRNSNPIRQNSVVEPSNHSVNNCQRCEEKFNRIVEIPIAVANFSNKMYGAKLCRPCQNEMEKEKRNRVIGKGGN